MEGKEIDNTLNWLFEKYLEDPNGTWDIAQCPENENSSETDRLHHIGRFLANKGYVKNHSFLEQGFTCTITTVGISKVSDGLNEVKYKILSASIEEKKRSIMEILDIKPGHFQRVYDYATYLKRIGIIECIFHAHDVYAEPTYFGREWYEANRPRLVN
jgi:hypothetical protein